MCIRDSCCLMHNRNNTDYVRFIPEFLEDMRECISPVSYTHLDVYKRQVEAQIKFGWEIDAYPVNEIAEAVEAVSESDVKALVDKVNRETKPNC